MATDPGWSISVLDEGRSGTVTYREGSHWISFYRELLGGDAVAYLAATPQAEWDREHPWARGRQREVCERVASALVASVYAQGCRAEFDHAAGTITFRKRRWWSW